MQVTFCPQICINNYPKSPVNKKFTLSGYGHELPADTISFSSKNILAFDTRKLTELVKSAITEVNYIGKGREGYVYKIPSSNYCVKIPHLASREEFGNWQKELSVKEIYNHVEAKADNGATIMKYIDGNTIANSESSELSQLPLKSYEDLLKQLTDAADKGLRFDSSPYNLIFNPSTKKLTAIDMYAPETTESIEVVSSPLVHVYTCLKTNNDISANRKLASNLFNIVINELQKETPLIKIDSADFSRFLRVFETGHNRIEPLLPQFKFLKNTMAEIFHLKQLEYRGENVSDKIKAKANYAKCIVKMLAEQQL